MLFKIHSQNAFLFVQAHFLSQMQSQCKEMGLG